MGTKRRVAEPVESTRLRSCSGFWAASRGKRVAGGKHWAVYAADRPDGAYLLLDVSGVAALLGAADRRLLGGPVEALRFESPEARDAYVRSRGWS